ncbi:polysaccharide pyruvyl transferase family protein [Pseudidiomarina aestuarii]|uniref:polysaccharide pyruvyl transferase family protein n=1 Tax=Pseudidiomarina aestuarii TaxID=624146 RepID=UPI001474B3E0|nr:polysaccharide pyruvyl transferase family protein [Pseudidiomarina aestuarii]
MLTVEVKGISFANKGAELMLFAIIDQFRQRGVDARFVVEPNGPYQRRADFGLWQKTRYIRKQLNLVAPMSWLPSRIRTMFGLINESEIDLVLDASGFSYGDQWNPAVARDRISSTVVAFNKRNVPVVLLPQALGPFTKPKTRKTFAHIAKHADLVFPRDDHSFQFTQALLTHTEQKHIKRCPDFTNLIKGMPAEAFDAEQHQICFIPNSKMVEKRDDGDNYITFMVKAIEAALQQNAKPFILIHEADADRKLTAQIQAQLSQQIPVLDPQHALKIKWIIGQSKVVVSSRYHGLVSALSQGVPVIATGWSHKYQELLSDYNCQNQLFDVTTDVTQAIESLQLLLEDAEQYQELHSVISAAGEWQREAVERMWDEVFALVSGHD